MITVRPVQFEDIPILASLASETFYETFAADNDEINMRLYMDTIFSMENMLKEFNDKDSLFMFACLDKNPIGYCKLGRNNIEPGIPPVKTIELERIYVRHAAQGTGAGAALMSASLNIAREEGFEFIWLGVWEFNYKALEFYKKWGFEVVGRHDFVLGSEVQNDLLMGQRLS